MKMSEKISYKDVVDFGSQHKKKIKSKNNMMKKKKVQVGKDQEKAQSEKDSHSKNRGGKKQTNNQVLIP